MLLLSSVVSTYYIDEKGRWPWSFCHGSSHFRIKKFGASSTRTVRIHNLNIHLLVTYFARKSSFCGMAAQGYEDEDNTSTHNFDDSWLNTSLDSLRLINVTAVGNAATGSKSNSLLSSADAWLNSSLDSLVLPNLTATGERGGNDASFAEYADLRPFRFSLHSSCSQLDSHSSFAESWGPRSILNPIIAGGITSNMDESSSTTSLVECYGYESLSSSFDMTQLFQQEDKVVEKRVRFGTVTVREFSLVHDSEQNTIMPYCWELGNKVVDFRLTLDWNHAVDMVGLIPETQRNRHARRLTSSQLYNRLLEVRGWTTRDLLTIDEDQDAERSF